MMADKLELLSLREAAAAITEGDLSAENYAEVLLEKATEHRDLNAFIALDPAIVLEQARLADLDRAKGHSHGRLHGVPIALKDNIDTRLLPTTGGTPALRGNRPARDAEIAARLFAEGAILFGKAGLHELSYGATNVNEATGAVRNPHAIERMPGGSSGGVAAAVAACIVPAGIGSDTGGSVRVPAALCGVVGLRPSTGRWPTGGMVPISTTRDSPGPLARRVHDLLLLDEIASGVEAVPSSKHLNGIRLAMPTNYFWDDLDPEVEAAAEKAIQRLRHAGAVIGRAEVAGLAECAEMSRAISLYETPACLAAYLSETDPRVSFDRLVAEIASPDVRAIFAEMLDTRTAVSAETYRRHMTGTRPALRAAYEDLLSRQGFDAVIFPTTPLPAPLIRDRYEVCHNGRLVPVFTALLRNADPGSCAGQPGISLPMGQTRNGLPVGISLDGAIGRDRELLAVARLVEDCLNEA